MPRYLINETSFIDNRLVQPGEEIDTDSPPAGHWEPLDKEAEKERKAFDKDEAARKGRAEVAAQKAAALDAPTALVPATPQEQEMLQGD